MDKELRAALRIMVTHCRRLLEQAMSEQLEGHFGIHPDGSVEPAARMAHLREDERVYREQTVRYLAHLEARTSKPADAALQLARELAFTHLNRLCALKLLERRRLIRETVSRGTNSNGFKFFLADHPEDEALWKSGRLDLAYRRFLEWTFARLGSEVPVLFSPHDPANRLFPAPRTLDEALSLINGAEIASVWDEDETVGWIYQYFTPKELRDAARKASSAPRNSYELAFRNQFYTPRYVVELLAENTLGRLWHEMRQGETALVEHCSYLLRRPQTVWLEPGANPPAGADTADEVDIVPYRPAKDPRDLSILDPACGSGHFLLYSFDLLLTIYDEAWDADATPAFSETGQTLREDYPDRERLRASAPGLILRHNLHGVDIDLRATQIAALALWLRAQRAYQELGLSGEARPPIRRANIVYAEPMPGEYDLLRDFLNTLDPPALRPLVEDTWKQTKLAGEAGSLLQLEVALRERIGEVKRAWIDAGKVTQSPLFEVEQPPLQLSLDFSGITDANFFERDAYPRVREALRRFAIEATSGDEYTRRLFAEDAERGFALLELMERRYDVVLMNPPFGEASLGAKAYIERTYPRTKNDLYAAFVERGLGLLEPRGRLGAITSRTGFFLTSFQKWREEILLGEAQPILLADLGYGVLDTAMVETAAYVLEKR